MSDRREGATANDALSADLEAELGIAEADMVSPCRPQERALSAWIGGSPMLRPTLRVVIGGAIALAATFLIGTWLGTSGVA